MLCASHVCSKRERPVRDKEGSGLLSSMCDGPGEGIEACMGVRCRSKRKRGVGAGRGC
jgi:hypothetical protein